MEIWLNNEDDQIRFPILPPWQIPFVPFIPGQQCFRQTLKDFSLIPHCQTSKIYAPLYPISGLPVKKSEKTGRTHAPSSM